MQTMDARLHAKVPASTTGACPIAANCAVCSACKPNCLPCPSATRSSMCSTAGTGPRRTAVISTAHAWCVVLDGARMVYGGKDQSFMLWPVRGEGLSVVPRSGQSLCCDAAGKVVWCIGSGQDGEWRYGAPWPEPRFEMLQEGVLDRLTRLLWRRSANLTLHPMVWREALAAVARLNHECAGSVWRLPTINELESLVECAAYSPALSSGHPFTDVQDIYWSSTASKTKRPIGRPWFFVGKGRGSKVFVTV